MFKYELLNAVKNINGTLYDCILVPACVLFVSLECIFLKVKVTGIWKQDDLVFNAKIRVMYMSTTWLSVSL